MAAELIAHNSQQAELIANKPSVPIGKTILTENHKTYDVTTYAEAETDIPDPVLIEKTFTENGTYSASEYDADGFDNVTVDVQPLLMDKTVKKNGVYKASDDGVQGYRQVNVNLPFEQKTVTPSTTAQTVTPSQGYEALESVTIEAVQLESATITPTTQQQTYTPQSPAIGFDSVTVEGYVPPAEPEWKYVNFIDYDGALLYSYTKEEVQALTEMPPLPVREGYTYQKWNWTLTTLKQSGKQIVGAVRMTSDGSTQLTFDLQYSDDLTVPLAFMLQSDEMIVDWGDGENDSFVNSASSYSSFSTSHTYQNYGRYTISMKLKDKTGYYKFSSFVLGNAINNSKLLDVCIGEFVTSLSSAFWNCISLKGISVPDFSYLSFQDETFKYGNFHAFVYPKYSNSTKNCKINIISLAEGTLDTRNIADNGNLKILCLPWSITDLSGYGLRQCGIISSPIVVPKSVTNIGHYALTGLQAPHGTKAIKFVDLSLFDDPTALPILAGTNSFEWVETYLVKNQTMLNAFESATNWSFYAGQYQIGGEYEEATT